MTFYNGATSQIRTGDPRITSAMLWPAELKWQNLVTPTGIEPMSPPWKGDVLTSWPRGLILKELNHLFSSFGELSATRTRDNLIKSQVLYHLS